MCALRCLSCSSVGTIDWSREVGGGDCGVQGDRNGLGRDINSSRTGQLQVSATLRKRGGRTWNRLNWLKWRDVVGTAMNLRAP